MLEVFNFQFGISQVLEQSNDSPAGPTSSVEVLAGRSAAFRSLKVAVVPKPGPATGIGSPPSVPSAAPAKIRIPSVYEVSFIVFHVQFAR